MIKTHKKEPRNKKRTKEISELQIIYISMEKIQEHRPSAAKTSTNQDIFNPTTPKELQAKRTDQRRNPTTIQLSETTKTFGKGTDQRRNPRNYPRS